MANVTSRMSIFRVVWRGNVADDSLSSHSVPAALTVAEQVNIDTWPKEDGPLSHSIRRRNPDSKVTLTGGSLPCVRAEERVGRASTPANGYSSGSSCNELLTEKGRHLQRYKLTHTVLRPLWNAATLRRH